MGIILQVIIFVCFISNNKGNEIEILDSGLARIRRNDILLRFFVTLQHHGSQPRRVFAEMVECCEKIAPDDYECDSIRLQDEYLMIIPGTKKNLTFPYANIYVYNRKGYCILEIWHRAAVQSADDKPYEMRHQIPFDTTLKVHPEPQPHILKDYYNPKKVAKCSTVDLDPFDSCKPVDCSLKYLGYRNSFHPLRKKCQNVPVCEGDPSAEMADVVYVPKSNTCVNIRSWLSEDSIKEIFREACKNETSLKIECHYGSLNEDTGLCICFKGYTSAPYDPNDEQSVYHMCNIKCSTFNEEESGFMLAFWIGFFLALWLSICVCFCEKYQLACHFIKKVHITPENECECKK